MLSRLTLTFDNEEAVAHGSLFRAKQWLYRFIKYILKRPRPFIDPTLAGKVVVVLGSAPEASKPMGMSANYRLITINGSQQGLDQWGDFVPHTTVMMFNQVEGMTTNAREVRRVLNGRRTGKLYVMLWRHSRSRLEEGLRAFRYSYEALFPVDRYSRVALVRAVSGYLNFELDASTKYSNGIVAVLLALHSGATAVILSGIDPSSSGHAYNTAGLVRKHGGPDMTMIKRLMHLKMPVYTADRNVARGTGLPLWNGD